jgi:hypothetical protein
MRVTTLPTFAAEVSAHKITRWLKVSIPCLATRRIKSTDSPNPHIAAALRGFSR